MELDYLKPFHSKVDIDSLIEIKKERDAWVFRKNTENLPELFKNLPEIDSITTNVSKAWVEVDSAKISQEKSNLIERACKELIPWKKGPFKLFNIEIDAEWRSDLKWDRLKDALNLKDKVVLDIGCNNGYFMFRALEQNPKLILGIDPVIRCQYQFKLIQNYFKAKNLKFELFGMDEVKYFNEVFDTIFHMGVIYHHRNPIEQLNQIRQALKPGGELILETIGIEGESSQALFPEDRYAKMRNVWFVPTLNCLKNWLIRTKFVDIEIISTSWEKESEQRASSWCPEDYKSFKDFLDPNDSNRTIEGYPAPMRFCLKAKKKG